MLARPEPRWEVERTASTREELATLICAARNSTLDPGSFQCSRNPGQELPTHIRLQSNIALSAWGLPWIAGTVKISGNCSANEGGRYVATATLL